MDQSARARQRVGDVVASKYRLDELLGAGGMGAVYAAVHQFTQRRVAVKLMHPSFARSGIAAERFLREAQAPSTIGHPGIVEVLDGGHDSDGSLYLVLELLQGETLADAIRRSALDPKLASAIALELLDALRAAHAAGFVHRDIKPENVFLVPSDGDTPLVKLLDFGVAGVLTAETKPGLTQAGSVLGTPLYMSPEQALGRRVDDRSDLWSVGAVMYQALSGRAPFGGESFQALVVSISTEEHLPLSVLRPELPVRLVSVVERALRKNVEQRWQSAEEMAEALQRALEPSRARAAPAQVRAPAVGVAPRTPPSHEVSAAAQWPLLAAGLVAVLATGAWWVVPRLRNGDAAPVAQPSPALAQTPTASPPDMAAKRDDTEIAAAPAAQAPAVNAAAPTQQPPAAAVTPAPQAEAPVAAPSVPAPAARALDSDALSAVLRQHEGELQRCYEEAVIATLMQQGANAQPALGPLRVDVELDVSANGEVERVAIEGEASAAMKQCMTRALDSWRFPNSAGPSQVRFPVIFQPNIVAR